MFTSKSYFTTFHFSTLYLYHDHAMALTSEIVHNLYYVNNSIDVLYLDFIANQCASDIVSKSPVGLMYLTIGMWYLLPIIFGQYLKSVLNNLKNIIVNSKI